MKKLTEGCLASDMQILPSVKEALLLVLRAHLMLFYFEGTLYFELMMFCNVLDIMIALRISHNADELF